MSEFGAYDVAALAWDVGPGRLYRAAADALLENAPGPLPGARVLDLGAGTGLAGRAALRHGAASVVAADRAAGMLSHGTGGRACVRADAYALPFADRSFDLVVAAFVLNHLEDPVRALVECRRVATAVSASTFDRSWDHPARTAVDEVMAAAGFRAPSWYTAFQSTGEKVKDGEELARMASQAGYAAVRVTGLRVVTDIDDAASMVEWRWGMAHLAPFVTGLGEAERSRLRRQAEEAVAGFPPVVVPMLALAAHG